MNPHRSLLRHALRRFFAPACVLFATSFTWAQVTANGAPGAAALTKYDKNKNGRLDADELAAMQADEAKSAKAPVATQAAPTDDKVVALSPFEVRGEEDHGYLASSTMSGTRLNSKLEDLGASITVVTKQQLLDTASVDINDIFNYEANTEGTNQFTNTSINVNGFTTDEVQQSPQTSNRVRGIGAANMSIGGFESNSRIPVDTYNLESVEISRGANSNLFGVGNASGTVNLNQSQGNLSRSTTQLTLRGDTWGGYRSSVNINRPIIKNKLAILISGLYDSKGFVRKPSGDLQRRQYGALTYKPFEGTTIRGSAEFMSDKRQTPNAQTPADGVSFWLNNGRPTWDPFTQTLHFPDGRPAIVGGTNDFASPGVGYDTTQFTRPSMYIDGGKVQLWTPNKLSLNGNPASVAASNASGSLVRNLSTFGENRPANNPLLNLRGISNRSLYDWENVNFSATNWNVDKAATYNVALDQKIFRTESQQLYTNLAWRHEYSGSYNHNNIRETSVLSVDINERLLDGRPNPYLLRPYVAVWDGSNQSRNSDNVDFLRGQVAYELDLRRKSPWISWLGLQRAVGFYESKFAVRRVYNLRDVVLDPHPWGSTTNYSAAVTGHPSYKYYLGDNQGFNIEYAPPKTGFPTGYQTFHYLAATLPNATAVPTASQFVDEQALFGETPISASRTRTELHTRGANLQSFLLKDRLITTLGYRTDDQRSRGSPSLLVHSDALFHFDDLETNGWTGWAYRSGKTKTLQTVVKPFIGWKYIDQRASESGAAGFIADTLRGLSFNYNKSDSLQPDAFPKKNLMGETLPDPNGQNHDYGFSLNMLHGKLVARVNWYKTSQKDARITGGASTANGRTNTLDTGTSSFTLYPWARAVVLARPANAGAPESKILSETYKLMQLPDGWYDQFNGYALSGTNDVTSKGAEYELTYNPNRNLRLKFTAARNQTIDSNLSNANQAYIDWRMPAWLSIKNDAGVLWWTSGGTTSTNNPSLWFAQLVQPAFVLARANLGKPRSQIKLWTWHLTGNYTFSEESSFGGFGDGWVQKLKGLSVGTALHWADRSAIGFYGKPDAAGIINTYDSNRPIYDPARMSYDFSAGYNLRFFSDKIRARLQLNARDVFSHAGSLRAVTANSDGSPANLRIVDGPQYILTTTFDF